MINEDTLLIEKHGSRELENRKQIPPISYFIYQNPPHPLEVRRTGRDGSSVGCGRFLGNRSIGRFAEGHGEYGMVQNVTGESRTVLEG